MKNFLLRFIVMLFACLVSMAGYADHDAIIYFGEETPPTISTDVSDEIFFNDKNKITITSKSLHIITSGDTRGLLRTKNKKKIKYSVRLEYSIDDKDWKVIDEKDDRSGTLQAGKVGSDKNFSGTFNNNPNKENLYFNSFSQEHTLSEEDFNGKAYITIYYRLAYSFIMEVEDISDRNLIGTTFNTKIIAYRCEGGNIAAESNLYKISEGNYGIYDTEGYKKNHTIKLYGTDKPVCTSPTAKYLDENCNEFSLDLEKYNSPFNTKNLSVYDFEYGVNAHTNSKLTDANYEVKLRYFVNSKSDWFCDSKNSISFKHYPKLDVLNPKLSDEERTKYVCANSNGKGFATLQGVSLAKALTETEKKEYGVEYKWDFSLNGSTWNEVVPATMKTEIENGNLKVYSKFVSEYADFGEILFRPKVYLSTFETEIVGSNIYRVVPYAMPTETNLYLSPNTEKVCANTEFDNDKGFITLKKKNASDVFDPTTSYTIYPNAERIDSLGANEIAKWKITDRLSANTEYVVSVQNANCGASPFDLTAQKTVENVSVDLENELSIEGCAVEYETDRIICQAKNNDKIKFKANSKNYKYVLSIESDSKNEEYTLPYTLATSSETNGYAFKLKKINNGVNSLNCESEEIPLILQVVEDINNNVISVNSNDLSGNASAKGNTVFICSGDMNPSISGTKNITVGFGDQTIIWQVLYGNGTTGKQIPNSENETYSLSKGLFEINEDCIIQRVVRSGNGKFESKSNPIYIKVYTAPELKLSVATSKVTMTTYPSPRAICYEEKPTLDVITLDSQYNVKKVLGETMYRIKTTDIKNGIKVAIDTTIYPKNGNKYSEWKFTQDAKITASQKFCGSYIEAIEDANLIVYSDLSFSEKDFSYDCAVIGKELELTPVMEDGSTFNYKVGAKTYLSNNIKLPNVADGKENGKEYVNVQVTRSKNSCQKQETIKIRNVMQPLDNRNLFVNGGYNANTDNEYWVCSETDYVITDNGTQEDNVSYSWSSTFAVNSDIKNGTEKDAVVSINDYDLIIRTRILGKGCEIKKDSAFVYARAKSVHKPTIYVDEDAICFGESMELETQNISNYHIESWKRESNEGVKELSKSYSLTDKNIQVSGDLTYTVTMVHDICPNYILTNSKVVYVAPNLMVMDSDIVVSPSAFNENLFDDKTESVNVSVTDKTDLGQKYVYMSFNGSDFASTLKSGGKWTKNFSITKDDMEGDMLSARMYRTYIISDTKSCVGDTSDFNFPISHGFASIEIGADGVNYSSPDWYNSKNKVYYFCGEGELVLVNDEIEYDEKVLDSKSYTLQWYRKGTNNNWLSVSGANGRSLKIDTKKLLYTSDYYKLVVSFTSGGKVYRQSSNVLEVKNVLPPALDIANNNSDMSFCYDGECYFSLRTNTSSNPQWISENIGNVYTWQSSKDGKIWEDLKNTSIVDSLYIMISPYTMGESEIYYEESHSKESVYLRAKLTDICGSEAVSNTLYTSIVKGMDLTAKDVSVLSNKLVTNADSFEVRLYANKAGNSNCKYNWYNEEGDLLESTKDMMISFSRTPSLGDSHDGFDYSYGKHKVYVEKYQPKKGNDFCKSERVAVDYELIEPLKLSVQSMIYDKCPNTEKQNGLANIQYLGGGVSENGFDATWFYRLENEEFFKKLDASEVNFSFETKENENEDIEGGKLRYINNLGETLYLYAEVHNEGYPIKSVKTNIEKIEIRPQFKIRPATSDKDIYCYGEGVVLNAGKVDTAYGSVTYRWIDLNDKAKVYPQTSEVVIDEILGSTTYQRVATDGCGAKDTSLLELSVRERLEMKSDEYTYATYAEKGKVPYIAVKDLLKVSSYTLSHIAPDGVKDVSVAKDNFISSSLIFQDIPKMQEDVEIYEIYKTDKVGCNSVADTFLIKGIEKVTAGTIAFESYGDAKSINICNGEKIGRIIDDMIASGGEDISYNWYYGEEGRDDADYIRDSNGLPIATATLDADTLNFGKVVASNNGRGNKLKRSFVYRTASMYVLDANGKQNLTTHYSDTLYINTAPLLKSCNIEDLAGVVSVRNNEYAYCKDVNGEDMRSGMFEVRFSEDVEDRFALRNFGALLQKSEDRSLYGYWEASKGSQKDFVRISDISLYEDDFERSFFISNFDTTTYVRFTISDGCSEESSSVIGLTMIDFDEESEDNYSWNKYIEVGDKVKVTNMDVATKEHEWYSNKNEASVIGTSYSVTLDSVTMATRLFHKRIKESTKKGQEIACKEADYFEVPLDIHPKSEGGRIASNQQICVGGDFKDILNYESAYGGSGVFRYGWEITSDTSDAYSWVAIDNAYTDTLPYLTFRKKLVSGKTNFVRRTARPVYNDEVVNKEAYIRYSNVVALETYKPLKGGEIAWAEETANDSYCAYEKIPALSVSAPAGGSGEYKNSYYVMNVLMSVDGVAWENIDTYKDVYISFGGSAQINAEYIAGLYFEDNARNKDITFRVKCVFTDKECGDIESNVFAFKVWAETSAPELYIGADSCDSKYISFKVENDSDYYYNWTIGTDSVNPVKTDFKAQYEMDFERHPAYIVESGYTIQGMHKVSGCKTDIVYFNVDSLPSLTQPNVPAQSSVVCYGTDLYIEMGGATGGTGSKSYLWQYSYDNEKWSDAGTEKDFAYTDLRSDIYVRRLAYTDICKDTIVSPSVLYKVADKVVPLNAEIEENLCKNQDMQVVLTDSVTYGNRLLVYRVTDEENEEFVAELLKDYAIGKIKGNEFDENKFRFVTYDSAMVCHSEESYKVVTPRPSLENISFSIDSEFSKVCEGTSVNIVSSNDYALPEYLRHSFEVSSDNKSWSLAKDKSVYNDSVLFVIDKDMYIRSTIYNGCKDSLISNSVFVSGVQNEDNPMRIVVETKSDGEVLLNASGIDEGTALSVLVNDSIETMFEESMSFGSLDVNRIDIYPARGSIGLSLSAKCYNKVSLKPLRGGNIFTECKSVGKSVVGEDIENAVGEVSYEWYKYDSKSDMYYFTDYTEKNLSLSSDEEHSRIFRKSSCGDEKARYVLSSNVITVNTSGPEISLIAPLEKDSLIGKDFKVTSFSANIHKGMSLTLTAFIEDAENGEWQSSENGTDWNPVERFASMRLSNTTLLVTPDVTTAYRIVAENSCGVTTTDSFVVSLSAIEPVKDDYLTIETDECSGDITLTCYDDETHKSSGEGCTYEFFVNGKYDSYKSLENGKYGVKISSASGLVAVTIKKKDALTNAEATFVKNIDLGERMEAQFSILADGIEYASDEVKKDWLNDVTATKCAKIESGTKIRLINRTNSGVSYKWVVYYDDIRMATSTIDNPYLYLYNEGVYSFYLTSYSGMCENSVSWIGGVRVPSGTLRSYTPADDDEEDFVIEEGYIEIAKRNDVRVYPTLFDEYIRISANGEFAYAVYNALGVAVLSGETKDFAVLNTAGIPKGCYTVVVNGVSVKVFK